MEAWWTQNSKRGIQNFCQTAWRLWIIKTWRMDQKYQSKSHPISKKPNFDQRKKKL